MPAYLYVFDKENPPEDSLISKANESINQAGCLSYKYIRNSSLHGAVSFVKHCKLGQARLFDNNRVTALFAGFLVDQTVLPWKDIVRALELKRYDYFQKFKAPFAVFAHFLDTDCTYIVSDRCSQYPLYYCSKKGSILASNSLATFFNCLEKINFEEKWLTDFFLFNFPICETTCIQGVYRMPPASVLRKQSKDVAGKLSIQSYAPVYSSSIPDCSEQETKECTYEVFKNRIPKYYTCLNKNKYAASVTAGFDSKVCICFKPEDINLDLYTYGIPGCYDIEQGRKIAEILGYKHHYISIDDSKLEGMFELAQKTIAFSGGMLNTLRTILLYVYEYLANQDLEAAITGISADHFFRSSGTTPHTFSVAAIELIKNPNYSPAENPYFSVFKNQDKHFEHYSQTREMIEKQYDWSTIPLSERQLTFAHYELAPKYFGGEHSLADNFVAMVSPFWDADIRALSYNCNLSTLTLTPFIYQRFPYWKRESLFSYILSKHNKFQNLPVRGLKPKYYAHGNKYAYIGAKLYFRGLQKILKTIFPSLNVNIPCERNNEWVYKYLLPKILENKSLYLSEYLSADSIHNICQPRPYDKTSFHLAGKIVTAEMLLTLIHKAIAK